MMFGRKLEDEEEKLFWKKCYELGMSNDWCNGKFSEADGNFIVEEDRLNKKSVIVFDSFWELACYFEHGNWCLGSSVIYRNLCMIQQDNGGDEYLTMKLFKDGVVRSFESISFGRMLEDTSFHFSQYIDELMGATLLLSKRDFVKHDKEGEILRDKEGLALIEEKECEIIVYGQSIEEEMKTATKIITD